VAVAEDAFGQSFRFGLQCWPVKRAEAGDVFALAGVEQADAGGVQVAREEGLVDEAVDELFESVVRSLARVIAPALPEGVVRPSPESEMMQQLWLPTSGRSMRR
jgi:hypothetical protein